MRKNEEMKQIIVISLLVLGMVGSVQAADQKLDRKQIYELRRECGADATRFFKEQFSGIDNAKQYSEHYNMRLNICLIQVRFDGTLLGTWQTNAFYEIIDVNENVILAKCLISRRDHPEDKNNVSGLFCPLNGSGLTDEMNKLMSE